MHFNNQLIYPPVKLGMCHLCILANQSVPSSDADEVKPPVELTLN